MNANGCGEAESRRSASAWAMWALVVLRLGIGWHFLYEGLVKLTDPAWTSAGYLSQSSWVFSGWFNAIAESPGLLRAVDLLNMFGLTLIGLGLLLGALTRWACLAGAALLALYYVANPPFLAGAGAPLEGSYLWLDKNAVELLALLALAVMPTGRFLGLDGLAHAWWKRRVAASAAEAPPPGPPVVGGRRELLRHLAMLPVLGGFAYAFQKQRGWGSFEVKHLADWQGRVDGATSATMKTFEFARLDDLKGQVPHARIGDLELSRVFLGGNLIGGWAHARDLIYADSLVKAYHTDAKVFETFRIAEQCGMNAILTNPRLCRVIEDYWRMEGGEIKFISDCALDTLLEGAQRSIDAGAHACYAQGGHADRLVAAGRFDPIAELLELTRRNGLPAGIGAHRLETVIGCVEQGLRPDFWVKTLHPTDYWSARIEPQHDNIWCTDPEDTIAYMEKLEEPWIAFKILAAGAVHPMQGFPFAFRGGADFLCVGMYDFQVVANANLALDTLAGLSERRRAWRA